MCTKLELRVNELCEYFSDPMGESIWVNVESYDKQEFISRMVNKGWCFTGENTETKTLYFDSINVVVNSILYIT